MCWVQVIYTMCVRAGNRIYKSMNMRGTAQGSQTTCSSFGTVAGHSAILDYLLDFECSTLTVCHLELMSNEAWGLASHDRGVCGPEVLVALAYSFNRCLGRPHGCHRKCSYALILLLKLAYLDLISSYKWELNDHNLFSNHCVVPFLSQAKR